MSTTTPSPHAAGTTDALSLRNLVAQTKGDRNRAIDVYRMVAMLAVAFGHWLAMVAIVDDGELVGGNALEFVPSMAWVSWLLQVMPLFFVVGGFSSAMSLDAHARTNGSPQDWVAARLRRMLPPAVALAGTWLVLLGLGWQVDQFELASIGAVAAAIPLWFLANYTIDTALAPFVLPRFRRHPLLVGGGIVGAFAFFEMLRVLDVPLLPQANWVLGWLAFQVLGMAWRDGLLPSGRRLLVLAAGAWALAIGMVLSGGPWSVSMVNVAGLENSPTNPPTLSLLVFGLAYSLTAIAAAPAVSAAVAARPRVWAGVVAANTVAMSVYLWHMTAAVIVAAAIHLTIGLPEVTVGSLGWWLWKLPTVGASVLVLVPIVAVVSGVERRALLAPRRPWNGGVASISVVAVVASIALKAWTSGAMTIVVPSLVVLVALGTTVLAPTKEVQPTN
ncbi:MAG: acyltransferase [Actinomycetota bacterium]